MPNSPFLKAISAGLATLIAVGAAFAVTGELDRTELAIGVTGAISAGLIYFTTNVPGWPFLKAIVPAFAGALTALGLWIETGEIDEGALQVLLTSLGLAALAFVSRNTSSDTIKINAMGSELLTSAPKTQVAVEAGKPKPSGAVGGKFGENH